jgi:threonine dehydrogenase-like Zn-dependent dehydrogenase
MSELLAPSLMVDSDLSLSVGTRALPDPGPDEARIRVQWAGLCGSDLHVVRTGDWVTEWPATLGHEIYGTVETPPRDGSGLEAGDAVVADSRLPCGQCPPCLRDDRDHCEAISFVGEARPGGFSSHCVLPARLLHRVPKGAETPTAVLSEPLAVVLHALSRLQAPPTRAAILGHGPVGALTHVELRRRYPEAEVDVVEPAGLRGRLARALGARAVTSFEQLPAGAYDTVIDAAGYAGSLTDALVLARPRAQVLVLALSRRPVSLEPAALVEKGLTLLGVNAFVDELPEAIERLAAEPWRYEPVITDAITLRELPDMIQRQLERPESIKVVVSP